MPKLLQAEATNEVFYIGHVSFSQDRPLTGSLLPNRAGKRRYLRSQRGSVNLPYSARIVIAGSTPAARRAGHRLPDSVIAIASPAAAQ